MNTLAIVTFALALAAASAGLVGHGHGVVLQGPSTKTTLVGPDGSHISGYAPGGQVAHSVDVGYAAHTGHVAPVVAHVAPVVAHVAHVAPAVAHSSIVRVDQIHSSPVVAHVAHHAAPVIVAHGDYGHYGYPVHGAGSGLEGQYVHDYTETLYDDGSYKGEHYDDHHHHY